MTAAGRARGDRGSAAVFLVIVITVSTLLIALVVDGGAVQRSRNEAFGLASGAARAGAQQLDEDARIAGQVVVDEAAARRGAEDYLAGRDATGTVTVDGNAVTVTVSRTVDFVFGTGSRTVSSTSTAVAAQQGSPP